VCFIKNINENEYTSHQNLWDTIKAVVRGGKLIALSASKKKLKKTYFSSLPAQLTVLQQQQQQQQQPQQ
jgi:hypothetical protein